MKYLILDNGFSPYTDNTDYNDELVNQCEGFSRVFNLSLSDSYMVEFIQILQEKR